jgi:hypothetical protein
MTPLYPSWLKKDMGRNLKKGAKPEEEQYEATVEGMYHEHRFKTICPSTIYKWLKLLGFRCEPRRKGYYVDGHEKPKTISYRNKYVQR